MKIEITMKNPDAVYYGLKDAGLNPNDISDDVQDVLDKWIRYEEYMTIEIDTETGEAIVVPA